MGTSSPLSPQAPVIAQAIGQAFGVAYQRFLEANSINPSELSPRQYSCALGDQEQYNAELTHFSRQENCKDVRAALEGGDRAGCPLAPLCHLHGSLSCHCARCESGPHLCWLRARDTRLAWGHVCCASDDCSPTVPHPRSASGSRRERSWASPSWSRAGAPSCPRWLSPT